MRRYGRTSVAHVARRMRRASRSLALFALVFFALLARPPAGLGESAKRTEVIRYEGSIVGDPEAGVVFKVEKRRGEYFRVVRFTGKNIVGHCADGTSFRSDIGPASPIIFTTPRTFEEDFHSENPDLGTQGSWEIWGRLIGKANARGRFTEFTDQSSPTLFDCGSGTQRWRARRLGKDSEI